MTKREFTLAAITLAQMNMEADVKVGSFTMADLIKYGEEEIERLNKKNATRSSKPTKAQIENEPIKEKILEVLSSSEKMVASAIAEKLEISTQKASALCRQLTEEGKLQAEEVKVPKKGKQKAYSVVTEEN